MHNKFNTLHSKLCKWNESSLLRHIEFLKTKTSPNVKNILILLMAEFYIDEKYRFIYYL